MIYFIGTDWDSPVKIGKAKDAEKRLKSLQVGNPKPLKILKLLRGYCFEEIRIHRIMKDHRIRGEWFDGRATKSFLDNAKFEIMDPNPCEYGNYNGMVRERLLEYEMASESIANSQLESGLGR